LCIRFCLPEHTRTFTICLGHPSVGQSIYRSSNMTSTMGRELAGRLYLGREMVFDSGCTGFQWKRQCFMIEEEVIYK
jgi:hypothetical protein